MGLAWAQAISTRIVLSRCGPHEIVGDAHPVDWRHPTDGISDIQEGFDCSAQRALYGLRQVKRVAFRGGV